MSVTAATSSKARIRLESELVNFQEDPPQGCTAQPKEGNLFEWTASIQGPQGSPYADGIFQLNIHYPEDYPYQPPDVTFATKIYHPNIDSESGFISLSILHFDWKPVLSISTILLSLRAFLGDPDPSDAILPEIAYEYDVERAAYEETAKQWTEKYATRAIQPGIIIHERK